MRGFKVKVCLSENKAGLLKTSVGRLLQANGESLVAAKPANSVLPDLLCAVEV